VHNALIVAEPPARYATRPPLVVDCSVVCAVLFQEAERDQAEARMSGCELHAPALLDYEVGNVALKKLRTCSRTDVEDGLSELSAATIVSHAVGLAERYALTAYDAAYLWLAAELKAPLATFDRKLGEAARQYLSTLGDGGS
jgi:predicted nucleic acid-binding protein